MQKEQAVALISRSRLSGGDLNVYARCYGVERRAGKPIVHITYLPTGFADDESIHSRLSVVVRELVYARELYDR